MSSARCLMNYLISHTVELKNWRILIWYTSSWQECSDCWRSNEIHLIDWFLRCHIFPMFDCWSMLSNSLESLLEYINIAQYTSLAVHLIITSLSFCCPVPDFVSLLVISFTPTGQKFAFFSYCTKKNETFILTTFFHVLHLYSSLLQLHFIRSWIWKI